MQVEISGHLSVSKEDIPDSEQISYTVLTLWIAFYESICKEQK